MTFIQMTYDFVNYMSAKQPTCLPHTSLAQFALYLMIPFPFAFHMKNFLKVYCSSRTFKKKIISSIFTNKCIKKYLSNYLGIHTVDKNQVLLDFYLFQIHYLLRLGPAYKNALKITFLILIKGGITVQKQIYQCL